MSLMYQKPAESAGILYGVVPMIGSPPRGNMHADVVHVTEYASRTRGRHTCTRDPGEEALLAHSVAQVLVSIPRTYVPVLYPAS
ncbi:unnamed protein product [Mycena citricolor]|uniref:Uncharacterized protein n=1 Tax=Mycena citricolor TaxID=2018698 RepID=A0AAD2Q5R8_9AGAR|nr:unnamed protein product [Mycena citricolor]CAK5280963.1 unnamed protein product [Mycena citricolor]